MHGLRSRSKSVLTHFSAPEMLDASDTTDQLDRFRKALAILAHHNIQPRFIHAGNSANVLSHAQTSVLADLAAAHGARLMMRPGLALYGYPVRFQPSKAPPPIGDGFSPGRPVSSPSAPFRPVPARVITRPSARDVPPALHCRPVGYADGLSRLLSNCGAMLLRGRRARIAGRVSMDQTILDVTDIPEAETGDEVVILGEQGTERLTAYDHADLCGTIPYEILCNISARVPRIAVD